MNEAPGPEWGHNNTGKMPGRAKGRRVKVAFANGNQAKEEGTTTAPPGWAADTTRWSITGSPFDVEWYRVL